MSVWKKAAKANQKTHRERHQPESRKHLGLLEKKKDYKQRADDYNEKRDTLKLLKKRALNKNPDEFYHHMINCKTIDGQHFEKEKEVEDTPEQSHLMQTQDIKYIIYKRTQESRKIEKLQSQLHLTNVNHNIKNQHITFEKEKVAEDNNLTHPELEHVNEDVLNEITEKQKKLYTELGKRIKREKELAIIQRKLEMRNFIKNKKNNLLPKLIEKGSKERAPIYKWKYERKK